MILVLVSRRMIVTRNHNCSTMATPRQTSTPPPTRTHPVASVRRSPRTPVQDRRGQPNVAASVQRSPRTPLQERVSPRVAASIRRSPRTPLQERGSSSVAASIRRSPRTPLQERGPSSAASSVQQHLRTQNPKNKRSSSSAAVEPPRRKNKKPKASSTQTGTGGRAPNYSEDEDYLISCAYVNVTADPIRGVGQKSETFWSRVHDKFVILSRQYTIENNIDIPTRNEESIEQRWKKKISKCVQLWNKFCRQLKSVERSGWNEDKYIEEAGKLYAFLAKGE